MTERPASDAGSLPGEAAQWIGRVWLWVSPLVPTALAVATFVAGVVLLVSGSFPAVDSRVRALTTVVPLGLVETSHLVASVAGLVLLVVARGLARRLDGAWHLSVAVLGVGFVSALLRGLDWVEAGVTGLVLVLLLLSRRHFYRRASLMSRPFTGRWLLGCAVVVAGALWLGFIVYDNTAFSNEQFIQFSLNGDVPRFLRAQVALATALVVLGLARLLRGAPPDPHRVAAEDRSRIREIVRASPVINANLALLGDKRFLFGDDGASFVMYGVSGDSWISLGDPIGPEQAMESLVWKFREEADLYDERSVFYQVRPRHLPLYLDAGLSVIKLGESARAPLADFSLEGGQRKDLRQSLRKGEKEQMTFEIVPPEGVAELLPELRQVSDEWLADKNASEKGFSLGCFDERYLVHFPHAVVRREGRILAFANVLTAGGLEEISVDLMRYRNEAPRGVMDYLFVQLMLWGRDAGYRFFHLGMAPLAGLEDHHLAPDWHRLGAWLFRHGEHFYNFQGLRAYKEKFDPVWEPRYLAAPDGLAMNRALFDVAVLISGGLRGLVHR